MRKIYPFHWIKIALEIGKSIDRKHKYDIYNSKDIVCKNDLFHKVKLPQKTEIRNDQQ